MDVSEQQFPSKKAEADAKRAVRVRSEAGRIGAAVGKRKRWEKSDTTGRLENVQDFTPTGVKYSVGQLYAARGFSEAPQSETGHPRVYDRQLPGMEDPYAAPTPKRWEEHTPEKQADIARRVKMRTGADLGSMEQAYGASLDQAYLRADINTPKTAKQVRPAGQDFYSAGEPKQVIKESAAKLGVPFGVHAAMNAITSPQTKFKENLSDPTLQARYPNNEAAEHVVRHMQEGGKAHYAHQTASYEDPISGETKRHSGYPANFVKAGLAYEQFKEGKPLAEWRNPPSKSSPEGSSMFGPKTGPYLNSWHTSVPDFLVSDVHTGGGGFLPHLGTEKPLITDKETGESRVNSTGSGFLTGKSEQEQAIETSGFHSMADFAAREAIRKRGLGSLRQSQAAQWNEQRIRRTETDKNLRNPLDTEERAYAGYRKQPKVNPDQFKLPGVG